jgi:hypothetical protein
MWFQQPCENSTEIRNECRTVFNELLAISERKALEREEREGHVIGSQAQARVVTGMLPHCFSTVAGILLGGKHSPPLHGELERSEGGDECVEDC